MRRSSRWKRNIPLMLPLGRTRQWERSCPRASFRPGRARKHGSAFFIVNNLLVIYTLGVGGGPPTVLPKCGIKSLLPPLIIDGPADLSFLALMQNWGPDGAIAVVGSHIQAIHHGHA